MYLRIKVINNILKPANIHPNRINCSKIKTILPLQIHKILGNSPAAKDGRLKKGDRILAINGLSMRGLTHRESITVLKVCTFIDPNSDRNFKNITFSIL